MVEVSANVFIGLLILMLPITDNSEGRRQILLYFGRIVFVGIWLLAAVATRAQSVGTPPVNDDLINASSVSGDRFTLAVDLRNATSETFEVFDERSGGCTAFFLADRETAWWRWLAPSNGILEWDNTQCTNGFAVTVFSTDLFGQLFQEAESFLRYPTSPDAPRFIHDRAGSVQVMAGESYFLRFGRFGRDLENTFPTLGTRRPILVAADFRLKSEPRPPNDDFAGAVTIVRTNFTFTVNLLTATSEPGEPRVSLTAMGRTIWYTWTAPDYGAVHLRTTGIDTNAAPGVGIYARGFNQTLTRITNSVTAFGNQDYNYEVGRSRVEWNTTPGQQYWLQFDRLPHMAEVLPIEFQFEFDAAPTNDIPANATRLEGTDFSVTVSTRNATYRLLDEAVLTPGGSSSVWFTWNAAFSGVVQITPFEPLRFDEPSVEHTTTTGGIETIVRAECEVPFHDLYPQPEFRPVFGTRDWLSGSTNGIIKNVSASEEFVFGVDGLQGTSGTTPMNILLTPPPINDPFTNRIILPSDSLKVRGRTFGAASDHSDPYRFYNGYYLWNNVWWEWRAPSKGRWVLFLKSGNFEHLMALHRGSIPNAQNEVGVTVDLPVIFEAEANEVFQIAAYVVDGWGSQVEFTLTPVTAPEPRFAAFGSSWAGRSAILQFPDNSGLPYRVDYSPDLVEWHPVLTNAAARSHYATVLSPADAMDNAFFRSVLLPTPP